MPINLRGLFGKFSSDTSTVTLFNIGTSAVTVAASNPVRLRVKIWNETGTLYVKEGAGASATNYTYRLVANTQAIIDESYTGIVTAIKQTGTTAVLVTTIP